MRDSYRRRVRRSHLFTSFALQRSRRWITMEKEETLRDSGPHRYRGPNIYTSTYESKSRIQSSVYREIDLQKGNGYSRLLPDDDDAAGNFLMAGLCDIDEIGSNETLCLEEAFFNDYK
ncbi:hypothetical protein V1478_014595 [Vespula squamosa]|uniref:Uncharacterized protein n=1 Tax=Vespula squamosa TaxID=30214 RepID=A0ABD2A330_VESSQ